MHVRVTAMARGVFVAREMNVVAETTGVVLAKIPLMADMIKDNEVTVHVAIDPELSARGISRGRSVDGGSLEWIAYLRVVPEGNHRHGNHENRQQRDPGQPLAGKAVPRRVDEAV